MINSTGCFKRFASGMDFSDDLEKSIAGHIYEYIQEGERMECSLSDLLGAAKQYCNSFQHCSDCPSGGGGFAECLQGNVAICKSAEEVFGVLNQFMKHDALDLFGKE